jgi:hypothetical protein
MPAGIRYLIGELFSPGRPPLMDVHVVPKQTNALAKTIDKLIVSSEYRQRISTGQSSQDAVCLMSASSSSNPSSSASLAGLSKFPRPSPL